MDLQFLNAQLYLWLVIGMYKNPFYRNYIHNVRMKIFPFQMYNTVVIIINWEIN